MLQTKPVIKFLLKAILIFSLLALPFSMYDATYGKLYKGVCKMFLGKFQGTGFALFTIKKPPTNLRIEIGNLAQAGPDGRTLTAFDNANIRYRGYIPTILFLSLVIASPISRKRKLLSTLIGLVLVTGFVILKQWIHIVYMCKQKPELSLYTNTFIDAKNVESLFFNFANYNGSTMIFAIAIWILVSFRKSDLEMIKA
jgi:hypothetical protein